jgi:membrane protein involved in colicin uptake
MKIYSEQLNKFYDTVEACQKDEAAYAAKVAEEKAKKEQEAALAKQKKEQALAERKAAAGKVEAARKAFLESQRALYKELENFVNTYGTYHFSTDNPDEIPALFDWLGNFFKL